MATDLQLNKLMKGEENFNGCYMNTKLPTTLAKGSYLCCLGNAHWIAIYNFGTNCFVFDPLALLFMPEIGLEMAKAFPFRKALDKQFKGRVKYNDQRTEALESKDCGQWSVRYLKEAAQGKAHASKWLNEKTLIKYR